MDTLKSIVFLSILCLCVSQLFAEENSTNYTVSTTVEVTETAINRFLQKQYNDNVIPQTVIRSLDGVTCTLNLVLPRISLLQNAMQLHMEINIISNIGNASIVIDPTVNTPSWSISLTSISSTIANLTTVVNALSLDSRLKSAIITAYNSLNLTMYPSKLVKQINNDLFAQKSINLIDPVFSVQTAVVPGVIRFTLSTYLSSSTPNFKTFVGGYEGDDHIFFTSNLQVTVKEIIITPLGGNTILYHGYPNTVCPKYLQSGGMADINIGNIGLVTGSQVIVKVRFQTDNTWFSRIFNFATVNHAWVNSTSSIN